MCVAAALCVDALGIARYGGEVNPRSEWLLILSAGTILWAMICWYFRPVRNSYYWRKRLELWWERKFPSLPTG